MCTLNPSAEERLWKGVKTMIDQVRTVSVPVSDQERAKDFYLNTLGFELRQEAPSVTACAGSRSRRRALRPH